MKEIKKEIVRHIGIISESPKGWKLELNIVRWDDGEPKLDLHVWSPDHEKCSTRGTFTREEAKALLRLLKKEV